MFDYIKKLYDTNDNLEVSRASVKKKNKLAGAKKQKRTIEIENRILNCIKYKYKNVSEILFVMDYLCEARLRKLLKQLEIEKRVESLTRMNDNNINVRYFKTIKEKICR